MNEGMEALRERYQRFRQYRQAFNPNGRAWYSLESDEGEATIYIYDAIGFFGIEAQKLVQEIDQLEATDITLRINSPGGDVFDGAAIYNAFDRHPAKVHVKIDGVAASMASLIALAGDDIEMSENAFYMIHKPWSIVIGSADDMRSEAGLLDKIESTAVGVYAKRSGMTDEEIRGLLAAETWYTAEEAMDAGFIDKVAGSSRESRFDLSMFDNAPETDAHEREVSVREAESALRDAGMSREQAKAVVARGYNNQLQRDAGTLEAASRLSLIINSQEETRHD